MLLNSVIYEPSSSGDILFEKNQTFKTPQKQIVLDLITSTCFILSLCGSM